MVSGDADDLELGKDTDAVNFGVAISDPAYTVGFFNDAGEYVEMIALDEETPLVMAFDAGGFVNLAISRDGEVFPFDRATGGIVGSLPRAPEQANALGLGEPYYGEVQLTTPGLDGELVTLTLDAEGFSQNDGFALNPPLWIPWFETFATFPEEAGPGIHGKDGWLGWDGDPALDALMSPAFSYEGPQSLLVDSVAHVVRPRLYRGPQWGWCVGSGRPGAFPGVCDRRTTRHRDHRGAATAPPGGLEGRRSLAR